MQVFLLMTIALQPPVAIEVFGNYPVVEFYYMTHIVRVAKAVS